MPPPRLLHSVAANRPFLFDDFQIERIDILIAVQELSS